MPRTLPPHSLDCENGILGCLLLEPSLLPVAVESLGDGEAFYDQRNKLLFDHFLKLGPTLDQVTLSARLVQFDHLNSVGGPARIETLLNSVGSALQLPVYIKEVLGFWRLRKVQETARKVLELSSEPNADPETLQDTLERAVMALRGEVRVRSAVTRAESVSEAFNAIDRLVRSNGKPVGVTTGIRGLDMITGGFLPGYHVIAAPSSWGKTTLALQFAEVAAASGVPVAYFTFEMGASLLNMRSVLAKCQMSIDDIRHAGYSPEMKTRILNACEQVSKNPVHIFDNSHSTPSLICAKVRRLYLESGVRFVVIDYLQQVFPSDRNKVREVEVASISKAFQQLSLELKIPVLCLSQLNRDFERAERRRPRKSDLRESGAVGQDADTILFIYADPEELKDDWATVPVPPCKLYLEKNRLTGPTGEVGVMFKKATFTFAQRAERF